MAVGGRSPSTNRFLNSRIKSLEGFKQLIGIDSIGIDMGAIHSILRDKRDLRSQRSGLSQFQACLGFRLVSFSVIPRKAQKSH